MRCFAILFLFSVSVAVAAEPLTLEQQLQQESSAKLAVDARRLGDARQGAMLFYDRRLSCATCHDAAGRRQVGPHLEEKRDGVSDLFLVESVLRPSKKIRQGFESVVLLTSDGVMRSGFLHAEDSKTITLLDPSSNNRLLKLKKDEIEEVQKGTVSAMPVGLINHLQNRQQSLDLFRFLMEINDGGKTKLAMYKKDLPELPELTVEDSVDHAGYVGRWSSRHGKTLERGSSIYQSMCYTHFNLK